jgi:threonyl-tRNA synthetase
MWDHAEGVLGRVLERIAADSGGRIKTGVNPGEGTFYGPKFEYTLRDAIGRDWQCGTTQIDFNLPERFGAFYIDKDSEKKMPVMVHRAICGSMERFLGILLEHYSGALPFWLAPVQAVVATIVSDADSYAREVVEKLERAGLRAKSDLRNEKINYKVREHSLAKVPAMLVLGKREMEEGSVNIRRLGSQHQSSMPLEDAIRQLTEEAVPPDIRRAAEAYR